MEIIILFLSLSLFLIGYALKAFDNYEWILNDFSQVANVSRFLQIKCTKGIASSSKIGLFPDSYFYLSIQLIELWE